MLFFLLLHVMWSFLARALQVLPPITISEDPHPDDPIRSWSNGLDGWNGLRQSGQENSLSVDENQENTLSTTLARLLSAPPNDIPRNGIPHSRIGIPRIAVVSGPSEREDPRFLAAAYANFCCRAEDGVDVGGTGASSTPPDGDGETRTTAVRCRPSCRVLYLNNEDCAAMFLAFPLPFFPAVDAIRIWEELGKTQSSDTDRRSSDENSEQREATTPRSAARSPVRGDYVVRINYMLCTGMGTSGTPRGPPGAQVPGGRKFVNELESSPVNELDAKLALGERPHSEFRSHHGQVVGTWRHTHHRATSAHSGFCIGSAASTTRVTW